MRLVFNASPIICLAKASLLEVTLSLARDCAVPRAVFDEIFACDNAADPALLWLQTASGASCIRDAGPVSPFIQAWDLGTGESAVIALAAASPGATAVLDDMAARRCAKALGVPVIGTLGLLLKAKHSGKLPSVRQAVKAVQDAGLFVSPKHVTAICQLADE